MPTAAGGEQSALDLLLVLAQPGEILGQIVFVEAAPDAVGMPLSRPMGNGLWEIRTGLPTKRTARVMLCL